MLSTSYTNNNNNNNNNHGHDHPSSRNEQTATTIEQVLTNFVDYMMMTTTIDSSSSSSSSQLKALSSTMKSRSFIEFILQDMVSTFIKAQKQRQKQSLQNSMIQTYCRYHSAKEIIPRMILFYAHKNHLLLTTDGMKQHRRISDDIKTMLYIVHQLIDFICFNEGIIDRKQRKDLIHKLTQEQQQQPSQHRASDKINSMTSKTTTTTTNSSKPKLLLQESHHLHHYQHDNNEKIAATATTTTIAHHSKKIDSSSSNSSTTNAIDECYTMINSDGDKIIQQLNILKEGGYWRYLPKEEEDDEEAHGDDGNGPIDGFYGDDNDESEENTTTTRMDQSSFTSAHSLMTMPYHAIRNEYGVDKENVSHLANQQEYNQWSSEQEDQLEEEDEEDEDDDDYEEYDEFDNDDDSRRIFQCCVLSGSQSHGGGFSVVRVTEDGWICCSKKQSSNNNVDGHLLRLPSKVAKLGRVGMTISGIDLMKRSDNGILEPCSSATERSGMETKLYGVILL